ncbi:hypothetical protein ACWC5I_01180, partial [Kitasatospora sp. NPDC001574]
MDTTTASPGSDLVVTPGPAAPALLAAAHLVDVGAPGMAGLALWLAETGADVTGSVPDEVRVLNVMPRVPSGGAALAKRHLSP